MKNKFIQSFIFKFAIKMLHNINDNSTSQENDDDEAMKTFKCR